MVFDKADWGPADGTVAGDWSASQKTGEALDAVNTDLSAFKAAGGKLIQYHGWSDAAIPAHELSGLLYGGGRPHGWRRPNPSLSTVCSWRRA